MILDPGPGQMYKPDCDGNPLQSGFFLGNHVLCTSILICSFISYSQPLKLPPALSGYFQRRRAWALNLSHSCLS